MNVIEYIFVHLFKLPILNKPLDIYKKQKILNNDRYNFI